MEYLGEYLQKCLYRHMAEYTIVKHMAERRHYSYEQPNTRRNKNNL